MKRIFFLCVLGCWGGFSIEVFAVALKGRVLDAASNEMMVGAIVKIKETGQGAATDLDGTFTIKHLAAGTYTVICSHVGYTTQERSVQLGEGGSSMEFLLQETANEVGEVEVVAERDRESDETARYKERAADNVMNVVSAKAIQLSPDITVANVVQRVSGISIERNSNGDGQYAIVRGMDKRYNYTLVNGVKIPSPDNRYRYVPLDIFPSELLDRLEVTKSLTPNLEGDAIGGAINMVMKDAPEKRYISANMATGYSQLFMDRDYLAFDQGSIHKESPYEEKGKYYNATVQDFPTGVVDYKAKKPAPNLFGGLVLGNRFLKGKWGVLLAGNYQNTFRGSNSIFFNAENVDTNKYVTITNQNERQYSEQQTRYGVHLKMDYRFNPRHKLQWYNAGINLTNVQTRDMKTTDFSSGYEPDQGNAKLSYTTRSRLTIQRIYNSTLQGEHKLTKQLRAQWSAVYSLATNQVPDNTLIEIRGERVNNVESKTTVNDMNRRWEHNSDQDLAGYLNVYYATPIAKRVVEWSAGGLYRHKTRHNFYNNYLFQISPNYVNAIYGQDFANNTQIPWILRNPGGGVSSPLSYDASEDIQAGYGQFKWEGFKTQVIGGVRVEATDQGYALQFPANQDFPTGHQVYTDVLPSVNIKHQVYKNQQIRASYFKSINRPGFFEIVPYSLVYEDYQERGTPNLQRAKADNVDLRYEYFPRPNEQIMGGIFYKYIRNPIEYTLQPDPTRGQDIYYAPGNFGNAVNYGLELDLIKYIRKWGIKANYTYTHSSITTPKSKRIRNSAGNLEMVTVEQTRPLYGQSAHIGNLTLLYKDTKNGLDAQLAASYTGERINTVAQFVDNDLWQKAFIQMDASVEKTFFKKWTVFAKANNLLNTPLEVYVKGQNSANSDIADQNLDNKTLIRKDYYQRSYMLGVRCKL